MTADELKYCWPYIGGQDGGPSVDHGGLPPCMRFRKSDTQGTSKPEARLINVPHAVVVDAISAVVDKLSSWHMKHHAGPER
jgi:hypothetical protein